MNHPLRENLEVHSDEAGVWTRCTQCLHKICPADKNWKEACRKKLSSPTRIGPLMKELVGSFLLEQMYCPSCGALMNSELVEDEG
jgi:hypothetical protein